MCESDFKKFEGGFDTSYQFFHMRALNHFLKKMDRETEILRFEMTNAINDLNNNNNETTLLLILLA